jgi:hypothetical protein
MTICGWKGSRHFQLGISASPGLLEPFDQRFAANSWSGEYLEKSFGTQRNLLYLMIPGYHV